MMLILFHFRLHFDIIAAISIRRLLLLAADAISPDSFPPPLFHYSLPLFAAIIIDIFAPLKAIIDYRFRLPLRH
jgi:hypothetical protein